MTAASANLDATALFSLRPEIDADDLLMALNARLAREPDSHLSLSPLTHQDWWLLTCPRFHVMVSVRTEPVERSVLKPALRSPVNTLRKFDFAGAVQTHRAALTVEIGDGATPLPPEARAIMQEFGASEACDPQLKLKVLHWALQEIAQERGLLAAHFGPSDRLFSPEDIAAAAPSDIPHDLLFHPLPGDPETNSDGLEGYSLCPRPSPVFDAPQPELEGIPRTLPLSTAVALLTTITQASRAGKLPMDHGCVLQPSEKRQLFIRHTAPDANHPLGRVIVSFWDSMGHDAPAPDMTPVSAPEPEVAAPAPEPENPTEAIADELAAKAEALANATAEGPGHAPVPATRKRRRFGLFGRKSKPAAMQDPAQEFDAVHHEPGDAILVSTDEARTIEYAEDIYAEAEDVIYDTVEAAQLSPTDRRFDMRLKAAGLAVILGLPALWNPYSDFTGGISVNGPGFASAPVATTGHAAVEEQRAKPTSIASGDTAAPDYVPRTYPEGEVLRPRLRPNRDLALLKN